MAIALENLQDTVRVIAKTIPSVNALVWTGNNTITDAPDNLDNYVLADDGTKRELMENALKKYGWVIVVAPTIGKAAPEGKQQPAGMTSPDNDGIIKLDVVSLVSIRTNPKANTGTNKIVLMVAVREVIKAVLSWKPTTAGDKGFMLLSEGPFSPDLQDEGCFTYDIRVVKSVAI